MGVRPQGTWLEGAGRPPSPFFPSPSAHSPCPIGRQRSQHVSALRGLPGIADPIGFSQSTFRVRREGAMQRRADRAKKRAARGESRARRGMAGPEGRETPGYRTRGGRLSANRRWGGGRGRAGERSVTRCTARGAKKTKVTLVLVTFAGKIYLLYRKSYIGLLTASAIELTLLTGFVAHIYGFSWRSQR